MRPPPPAPPCSPTAAAAASQVQLPKAPQREAILRLTLRRYALEAGPLALDADLLACVNDADLNAWAAAAGTPGEAKVAKAAREAYAHGGGGGAPAAAGPSGRPAAAAAPGSGSSGGGGGEGGGDPTLRWLAAQTEGFSGSDLVQLCSQAAAVPIQEHIE